MSASSTNLPVPRPLRLRAHVPEGRNRPSQPPLGVDRWTDDGAEAIAVTLELPAGGQGRAEDVAAVARQIPLATSLARGTIVYVLGDALRPGGFFPTLFGPRKVSVPRSLRSTALLARGFIRLSAGIDEHSGDDVVWGWVP